MYWSQSSTGLHSRHGTFRRSSSSNQMHGQGLQITPRINSSTNTTPDSIGPGVPDLSGLTGLTQTWPALHDTMPLLRRDNRRTVHGYPQHNIFTTSDDEDDAQLFELHA